MSSKRFLIIDDSPIELELLKILLDRAKLPIEVQFANCGEKGLSYIERLTPEEFPDIIISDINLLKMTGIEFFETLSKRFPNSLVSTSFFLTSSTPPEEHHKKKFTQAHVKGFIEKPLMERSLIPLMN